MKKFLYLLFFNLILAFPVYAKENLIRYYQLDEVNPSPVTIKVHGKTNQGDIVHTFKSNYGKKLPIMGLYSDYKNTVSISGDNM